MSAGYSGTPLIKKLGLPAKGRALVFNSPHDYGEQLKGSPPELEFVPRSTGKLDFIHLFVTKRAELKRRLPALKQKLSFGGSLWVSWPKKTSPLAGDVNENVVREIGLAAGLVDVKVCAIDEDWSGLKFVYRMKDRE